MQLDGLTLKAFAGVAAVIAERGAVARRCRVGLVVPMMGVVAGVAVMLGPASTGSRFVSRLSKRRLA
jgi:hypothetical protein